MNILFISPYVPSLIRSRSYSFIRALVRHGHVVTLVCSSGADDTEALAEMRTICARVIDVQLNRWALLRNVLRALPGDLPLQAALNFDPRLLDAVRAEARSGRYDVAHIEHLRGSALAYGLLDLPVVLDSVDSISLLFERTRRSGPTLKSRLMALVDLERTRRYEAEYTLRYDQVVITSPEDAQALVQLRERYATYSAERQNEPVVVPSGVDLEYFAPQKIVREPATIVFSGKMAYHANEAAALYLVHEIMPLVWQHRPDARVVIAGSSPPRSVRALAADARVAVTGFLPDLRPALARATVAACPLRYGVGIQHKVLEAMAMATPVVAARQAAKAISAVDGCDLLLAGEAVEYAQAILGLIDDPERAAAIGAAGRRYVERHHNWQNAALMLEEIYHAVARGVPQDEPAVPELLPA